ncbi:unnamed protein product [Oikopleura dioica]|uniref:Xylulose kinase n=1 Tax=Oikopleura dioica TaxID=34765 RepID=E4WRW3_OIKDI|nr:unnamed protein product [Oikopleura dioica]
MTEDIYLGLDLSTQQLKAIFIDDTLKVIDCQAVRFDDLDYETTDGYIQQGNEVGAPTLMFVEAFDVLFSKLNKDLLSRTKAISASGQQHGSVYWRESDSLKNLDPSKTLKDSLVDSFTKANSPIWMDSSTTEFCEKMEKAFGGKLALAKATGSSAYERFTIHQIAKFAAQNPEDYKNTERISLISSFAVSLFLGDYAPIDFSDGSGMNFLNISAGQKNQKNSGNRWIDEKPAKICAKLGVPKPSNTVCGTVHDYWTKRFGIGSSCQVVAATGDNPSSLAGLRLRPGDLCLSLGTSDTVMLSLDSADPQSQGHIFINPLDSEKYMGLLCYKNGSLTREAVKNKYSLSWDEFSAILTSGKSRSLNLMQINLPLAEITPSNKLGRWIYEVDDSSEFVEVERELTMEEDIVSFIEGQFLAKRFHVEKFGFQTSKMSRLIVTGGASKNKALVQTIADIFQVIKSANIIE